MWLWPLLVEWFSRFPHVSNDPDDWFSRKKRKKIQLTKHSFCLFREKIKKKYFIYLKFNFFSFYHFLFNLNFEFFFIFFPTKHTITEMKALFVFGEESIKVVPVRWACIHCMHSLTQWPLKTRSKRKKVKTVRGLMVMVVVIILTELTFTLLLLLLLLPTWTELLIKLIILIIIHFKSHTLQSHTHKSILSFLLNFFSIFYKSWTTWTVAYFVNAFVW